MPRLERTTHTLRRDGPVLQIRVEPVLEAQAAMRADGDEIPSATILALLDTGASGTLIQTSVVDGMGLDWISEVRLRTASTVEPLIRYEYRLRLVLSENIVFEVDAVEGPLVGQKVQCLIGRDILEQVVLIYDGPRSRFSVKMP